MTPTTECSRHISNEDLYRTILLEEGCDLDAPRMVRPAPAPQESAITIYSTDTARWVPRLHVWFCEALAG